MAIGVSASSPYPPGPAVQRAGGEQEPGVQLGLRGVAAVGSGLRTGVTIVHHTIRSGVELDAARHRAREAALQERLEHEAAEADAALHEQHHRRVAEVGPPADTAAEQVPAAPAEPEDDATRRTIEAAVAAGEAGDFAPRGAYLDVSV